MLLRFGTVLLLATAPTFCGRPHHYYQLAFRSTPAGLECALLRDGQEPPFLTWRPPAGHGCEITNAPAPYNHLTLAQP